MIFIIHFFNKFFFYPNITLTELIDIKGIDMLSNFFVPQILQIKLRCC